MTSSDMESDDAARKGPTAPYPAFQTLKTLLKPFKEHGIPNKIDRSVLTSFSGAVGSQVLTMLRFLGLIADDGRPTNRLRELLNAYETDHWPKNLAMLIRSAYAPLFRINLETASPKEFNEEFRRAYPASEEVSRKSITFFLNATREAEIKISPYVMKNKKPRAAPGKKRPARQNASKAEVRTDPLPPPEDGRKLSERLLAVLDSEDLTKEVEQAVFTVLRHLRKEGQ